MKATAFLVLFALARVASADNREDARTEFALGQQADKDKDYTTAIQHFTRANELVPHPFALFNIAADYERLGALREAAHSYELYLDAVPAGPEHDKVARLLVQLQTRPASLSVRTLPGGARVKVDGNVIGTSPVNVTLPGGTHHVSIDRGRDHDERDVELQFGEPKDVVFSLSGTPGRLYVFGDPAGAFVAIDNITVGVVPGTFDVAAGPHTVRVSSAGYTPFETAAQIESGQSTNVEARLPRDLSTVGLSDTGSGRLVVKYALGAVGGADLSSGDPAGLAELAIGSNQYEGVFRLGRANGATQFDALFRWTMLPTAVSPFLVAGYSGGGIGSGYLAEGGLRWDINPDGKVGFSILAAVGARVYSQTDSTGAATGANYPLELTAEVRFR